MLKVEYHVACSGSLQVLDDGGGPTVRLLWRLSGRSYLEGSRLHAAVVFH